MNHKSLFMSAAAVIALAAPSVAAAESLDDFSISPNTSSQALATRSLVSAQSAVISTPNGPEQMVNDPQIVVRSDHNANQPPPTGPLSTGINGIGQIVTDQGGGFVGLCTGTLINPRTVIFAAHCVNEEAASAYGAASGGTAIMVDFNDNTLATLRQWLGLDGGTLYASNPNAHYFNINQVWYDPRSLADNSCTAPGSCFLQADVALGTLDTPATGIPTWALLFSPLSGPTHGVITGYGNSGTSASRSLANDWRRRAAENIISLLGSLDDVDNWLFSGGPFTDNPQNLYQLDFNDPAGTGGFNGTRNFDFGIFNDSALPNEGITAPGDSGGPLIADQAYNRSVVVGVLSGGSRYFSAQLNNNYGATSFYQPLYLFWDVIVANNPYAYTAAKAGDGAWEDPNHWVQLMDPNYFVDIGGSLVNALPTTPANGTAGGGPKFGSVCFLGDCIDLTQFGTSLGANQTIVIPGGPGSTNFVPNNVDPDPAHGVRAHYYDVTLSKVGTTTLSSAVTVDRFSIQGTVLTLLNVRPNGTLTSLVDYTQLGGQTNVDGRINVGGDYLLAAGLLTGLGTIRTPFLTSAAGRIAPAQVGPIGTLTVEGNVILASGSRLQIDLTRTGSDVLRVVAGAGSPGQASLGGIVQFQTGLGTAPRAGQSYTFLTAAGGVDLTFDSVQSNLGTLQPTVTYGPNSVTVSLAAGSLAATAAAGGGGGGIADTIANLLDQIRNGSYDALYGLYGAIDVMNPQMLAATLRGLAPDLAADGVVMQDRQSRMMMNNITDRLGMLGTIADGTMSFSADSGLFSVMAGNSAPSTLGVASVVPASTAMHALPRGVTGFAASGFTNSASTIGSSQAGVYGGQRNWYASMGLETQVADHVTFGTAFGYSHGITQPGAALSQNQSTISQVAAYGSYRLGHGAYVAGVASAEISRFDVNRAFSAGNFAQYFGGATSASRYTAMAETGMNLPFHGLTVTPRASLTYSNYHLSGFQEQGGEDALKFDSLNIQRLESRIGASVGGEMRIGRSGWRFQPQLRADFVSALSGANNGLSVRFAAAPDAAFMLPIAGGDRAWGEVRGGLHIGNGRMNFGAGVESSLGRSDYRDDRAVADFTVNF
ncbi:autotransporter domain-containing protein [Sphingosinicella ginsenosidimutans]|uniref:Autotransporter domain-containing protein n=2 Tax=Allosphingosinicella ginsenosidimutans TaxID=1176539 RepID=A0A5C6TSM5_9SPHN|nr:autotransporter domain-containing protein [Sphingosinicella ginsenosidimutans]